MQHAHPPSDPARPWHTLLAPLPPGVTPERRPIASPEVLATPAGASVAGWKSLVVHLSAGAAGLRTVLVTLDEHDRPLSAGDTVLYQLAPADPSAPVRYLSESIGGRFEPDGSFRGTRWRSETEDAGDEGEDRLLYATPSQPTEAEVAGLRALVAEVCRRAQDPRRGG